MIRLAVQNYPVPVLHPARMFHPRTVDQVVGKTCSHKTYQKATPLKPLLNLSNAFFLNLFLCNNPIALSAGTVLFLSILLTISQILFGCISPFCFFQTVQRTVPSWRFK